MCDQDGATCRLTSNHSKTEIKTTQLLEKASWKETVCGYVLALFPGLPQRYAEGLGTKLAIYCQWKSKGTSR